MNKEEMRKAFECHMKSLGFLSTQLYKMIGSDNYGDDKVHYAWEVWKARQPEIDKLKEDNERLFNVIKQAKVLAGGSERDNAHDMDQQLCEIWLLCDECEQVEK